MGSQVGLARVGKRGWEASASDYPVGETEAGAAVDVRLPRGAAAAVLAD